jgi:hypothetical protein
VATARVGHEPAAPVDLLLAGREGELLPAVAAGRWFWVNTWLSTGGYLVITSTA